VDEPARPLDAAPLDALALLRGPEPGDGLAGEVHDGVHALERGAVLDGAPRDGAPREGERLRRARRIARHHGDLEAPLAHRRAEALPDEPGRSRDQHAHAHRLPIRRARARVTWVQGGTYARP